MDYLLSRSASHIVARGVQKAISFLPPMLSDKLHARDACECWMAGESVPFVFPFETKTLLLNFNQGGRQHYSTWQTKLY